MKQLVCELCESTEFAKQDGMFVCQSCGTKYSLEEAKKMMSEVDGVAPAAPKNSPQLDNLLNLARSSFESKNYAQAEEFCNQVIAIDGTNYEAWKIKGEAINYQIGANNQRILEVYNCLMTAYRVLNDEEKEDKKYDLLDILKTCFEGEVRFWLEQFEAGRPTDAALVRAKNAYVDAYNKMASVFDEFGMEESKFGYLINLDNFFIGRCNATCNDAWKSTVGYNYYRDYMNKGKDPFGRTDRRYIIENTDLYRPTKKIWDTFISETDNLIALLKYAEEQFNDETNPKVMEAIYSNIAYFEECAMLSGSWHITQGYSGPWEQYKSVGWAEEYCLNDTAKNIRKAAMSKYRALEAMAPKVAEKRQREKEEKARQERNEQYWADHQDEKAQLEQEKEELAAKVKELEVQIKAIDNKNTHQINALIDEMKKPLPTDQEVEEQRSVISALERQRDSLGFFKGKEKKAIQERIDTMEYPKLNELKKKAEAERNLLKIDLSKKVNVLKEEGKDLRDQVAAWNKRIKEIDQEFIKDR